MSLNLNDRVTIYLALESVEFSPSTLTSLLGIQPDKEWLKGEFRGKTGKPWDHNGWIVETVRSEENANRTASELIPIAIAAFERKISTFAKSVHLLADSVERYTVLEIIAEEVPGIELNQSFLQLLVELGGTFQVDITGQLFR